MSEGVVSSEASAILCLSCNQLFTEYDEWRQHADGPFADVDEARRAAIGLSPGEPVPAGVRMSARKCTFPDEDLDAEEWVPVENGDYVYDEYAKRFVGVVAHHDATALDVETPDGDTVAVDRADCAPPGRYRVVQV